METAQQVEVAKMETVEIKVCIDMHEAAVTWRQLLSAASWQKKVLLHAATFLFFAVQLLNWKRGVA